ncbi:MFS transporter [Nocardioides sp.]|uniref:MFS transporter n=1 Tax=Nocardioides sp. TaxID=35761 RepID=UPI00286BD1EE|nr:MFS transporter [Nocardioides sp.]
MSTSETRLPRPRGEHLHRPGTPGFRRLNLAMGLAGLAAFGMLYTTQPLLPELSEAFAVGPTTASLTLSVCTGLLALLVVPATALGQRWGRPRTMGVALLVAAVLTLASAVAPTFAVLLVLRALTGAALAAVVGVAMGHVGVEVHPSGLATAMGLYVAGNSLGGVGGRLITSAVVDVSSWRWAMAALGLAALAATAAFWRLLPAATATSYDAAGEPAPTRTRAYRELLTDPAMLAVLLIPFVLMGGFVATYNYLAFRLTAAPFSLPAAVVGLVFVTYLSGTASSALAGRAANRVGRGRVLLGSVVVMGAGLALTLPDHLVLVVVGLLVLTAGFFGAHSVASGWAPVVGRRHPSQASALYVCAYYVGSSVFGALVGLSWRAGAWPATVASVGALVAVGLVASLVVVTRVRPVAGDRRPELAPAVP